MNQGLQTYLHDHIAGAEAAVAVIGLLREHSEESMLTVLLTDLLLEVNEDKAVLEALAASLGTRSSELKNVAAWIGARVVNLKARGARTPFGAFEGLEFLSLGIQGKLHLWKALQRSSACAEATYKPDFISLMERAEAQHGRVERLRLELAVLAL